ncbi:hypothetical protein [Paraglaciecola aestuariivivens]
MKKIALVFFFLLGYLPISDSKESSQDLFPSHSEFNFEYKGAFKFSTKPFGSSRMPYANGTFAINPNGQTLFAVGHNQHQSIAEFEIPELRKSNNTKDLLIAKNIQPFTSFLRNSNRLNNPEKLDRISGMEVIEGELFVNAVEFYDAPANNKNTTFIIRDINSLANSKVDGFFSMKGAAHSAGWISKLPPKWRKTFSASFLNGYAGNYAINSRLSMGPTAFVSYIDAFAGIDESNGLIPTRKLMDFSIKNPMVKDLYNKSGNNKIWTEVSNAYYGFIVPETDLYLVIGNSGGHESKIGYKAKQTNGKTCAGPCAYDPNDYYNFFWIFDVNDFIRVQEGKKKPYELLPKTYGKLSLPFAPKNNTDNIIGADFDEKRNLLYLLLKEADRSQSQFELAPVMLVYKLKT